MKKILFIILATILSSQVMAQNFKLVDSGRVNFNVCQVNHNLILDKFINQMNSQGSRLMKGISLEITLGTHEYKLGQYRSLLTDVVLKRIIYSRLKSQLNRQTLNSFYSVHDNYHKDFLNVDSIQVDLGVEFSTALQEIKNIGKLNVAKDLIKNQYDNMLNEALNRLTSKRYQKIGAGVFSRIIGKQSGKIATGQILKRTTLSFGSKLFISASKGLIIDLLVMPLKGSRLPPETLWTDLLEEYPELIIVPEWMKRGGVDDHPWSTHCNAIQRSTKRMQTLLNKILKLEETNFIKRVTQIHNLKVDYSDLDEYEEESNDPRLVEIDNTYLHKPIIPAKSIVPKWAQLPSTKK